jgi:hypothetical protein
LGTTTSKEIVKMGWHKFQGIERRERKGKKEKKKNRRQIKTLIMTSLEPSERSQ